MKKWRIIAVGVLRNYKGQYLLCKKPDKKGVFPGKWGLPGGGIEEGESMYDAIKREMREEVGLEVDEITPILFKDGEYPKLFPDGTVQNIYMIFLIFSCRVKTDLVKLNDEFESFVWADSGDLKSFDLDEQTIHTFTNMGVYNK